MEAWSISFPFLFVPSVIFFPLCLEEVNQLLPGSLPEVAAGLRESVPHQSLFLCFSTGARPSSLAAYISMWRFGLHVVLRENSRVFKVFPNM